MKTIMKYLTPSITALALTGCVVTGQIAERRGTKAYLLKDYTTAHSEYTAAIAEGNADAQYHLAVMYAEGQGVEKNLEKAAELLKAAAAQGQMNAKLMLGLFYIYGDGVTADPAKGARMITEAAEAKNDVAMYYLANLYAAGLGVEKDIPTALMWLTKAKKNGFPVEDEQLSEAYLESLYED
ncbi:tetratricopeptide repeat protein [uncultured Pseudodesulfovibrio sp.]|uniref:tetratricopeptide repeat protein n=1 Tax=uncultured Pseudodesulfovibrio sp. TaxID=2035858 RepID=UPI0029C71533|nr:tetratricopeptide repeat protein [uncultured Pseudodesulfovibrio sp.]